MRPISLYAFLALVFFGFAFSFSAADYLYDGEENATVSYANFTFEGSGDSLVSINNTAAFLLKDGSIIKDPNEMYAVLKGYYAKTYYPSEAELQEVRSLVDAYNKSRNDGYGIFKNQEEYSCRQAIFSDKRITVELHNKTMEKLWCHDDETCEINAKLLYSFGQDVFHWPSYTVLIQPLKDFSYSSYGTEEILSNFMYKLDNMNEDNIGDSLSYMKDSIPLLKSYADKMESSIFRYPRMNDSTDKLACKNVCYAICPPMDIDQEGSLMLLKSKLETLYDKTKPLADFNTTLAALKKNTEERVAFYESEKTGEKYDALFAPLEEKGLKAENDAKDLYLLIANTSLSMKAEEAGDLRLSIRERINNKNFTALDEDISRYAQTIAVLKNKTAEVQAVYDQLVDAKKLTMAILFDVGSRDLGADDQKKYDELRAELDSLDAEFVPGLSPFKAEELRQKYLNLASEATALRDLVKSAPTSSAFSPFRVLAVKANAWLADTSTKTSISKDYPVLENKSAYFGGFAMLLFSSFFSISFMLFLTALKFNRSRKFVYASGAVFVLIVLASAALSAFLFFLMDETTTDATLDEFLRDFHTKSTVAIVIDKQVASASEEKQMKTCASAVAQVLQQQNKSVGIFVKAGDNSTTDANGRPVDPSLISQYEAIITFSPSATMEAPVFSTVFSTTASIKSTEDYYNLCPLTEMLKQE